MIFIQAVFFRFLIVLMSLLVPGTQGILTGAEQTGEYVEMLRGKRVGIVANHTSLIGGVHLVDSLLSLGIDVRRIFSPEHGFRGMAGPGQPVEDDVDKATGLPVISLYGEKRKPDPEDLNGLDIIVYDIQDVGVRFFTYISTLHYVMEACAREGRELLVLDRPNPNGFFIDGPVLDTSLWSFVGLHPVPVVYGMTVAEYARMINGEGWLEDGVKCPLDYVKCRNYTHRSRFKLPVSPSPNLPNMNAVYLYPSLALFEGTVISVGRGTGFPFETFGHPGMEGTDFTFIPVSIPSQSMHPKHEGDTCRGFDLRIYRKIAPGGLGKVKLDWLIYAYHHTPDKVRFFKPYFYQLTGTDKIPPQIILGYTAGQIRKTWEPELAEFRSIRAKYLLYR